MGETMLNYVPCEHGFFWWGGYGNSTEHTAYLNLLHGIDAPASGSMALNGAAVAEQIGGQIFIDTWGLVNPCDERKAARFAQKMASVTHDGNGVYGGMFVAACVSAAFNTQSAEEIIQKGLSVIPADCEYARVTRDVIAFHQEHPADWRECFRFVKDNYGYDRYPGACHIIPNAAVIILSLLYGENDFSRSINIANMCGWDTDCNVANVGCILGVMVGLEGIDPMWTEPINDFLACSSVLGCENIRDVANDALYLARLGYRLAGEKPPAELLAPIEGTAPRFSFVLPRSTHTFRSDNAGVTFSNVGCTGTAGGRALLISVPESESTHLYRQTYYQPKDFNDNRYSPAFTPEVFPGQDVIMRVKAEAPVTVRPYVLDLYSGSRIDGETVALLDWTTIRMHIPAGDMCIGQIGLELIGCKGNTLLVDYLTYEGTPDYTLSFSKAGWDYYDQFHTELSQTTNSKGIWEYRNGQAYGSCADYGELFTGDIRWKDYAVTAAIRPEFGRTHLVGIRIQGNLRGYWGGLCGDELVLFKKERELKKLIAVPLEWQNGTEIKLGLIAVDNRITLCVNGAKMLEWTDTDNPWLSGFCGLSVRHGSRSLLRALKVGTP